MSYIKLKIRSGGIYIKTKKISRASWLNVKMGFMPHSDNQNQQVINLVRDSSIKGLFAYLIGETAKIRTIEQSAEISVKKLNRSLDSMVQAVTYKKISESHVTTFFERKDTHRVRSNFSDDRNINLYQHSFETADSTIKLLQPLLKAMFDTESIGEINKKFQKSKVNKEDSDYNTLKSPNSVNIPETKLGKKMKNYFEKFYKKNKPIYRETLNLIGKINSRCLKDSEFKEKFQKFTKSQFSIFESPEFTKVWIDKKYWKIVRGTPAFIACVDFDAYLSEEKFKGSCETDCFSWNEVVHRLKKGPNIARWGEGGVVFIQYDGLDEMGRGYDQKDQMFVEINALRKAGMKIKKYDWEKTADKNKTQ